MGNETSAIIPTHNRPRLVLRAIESVASQTRPPSELIVVNDGSTLDYGTVEETLADLAIDTVYLDTPGWGASAARNFGVSKASGDVLMFLDDDDRWRSGKVARQLDRLTGDVGLVYSGRMAVDQDGNELYRVKGDADGDLSTTIIQRNAIGTTSSPAIRRDVFDDVGGFDESMPGLQDWELWIRICQRTAVAYDPAPTVEWTVHDSAGSQMTSQCERYVIAIDRLQKKHKSLFDELSVLDRRKARAYQHKSLAKKYDNAGSLRKYEYATRSLSQWPSVNAAARLLPSAALTAARSALS